MRAQMWGEVIMGHKPDVRWAVSHIFKGGSTILLLSDTYPCGYHLGSDEEKWKGPIWRQVTRWHFLLSFFPEFRFCTQLCIRALKSARSH